MRERPILFSAPMVRALLAGQKRQTRRLVKHPHIEDAAIWTREPDAQGRWEFGLATGAPGSFGHGDYVRCPYGVVGDRLWVRETWQAWKRTSYEYDEWEAITREVRGGACWAEWIEENGRPNAIEYRADGKSVGPWTPAIHMPRWASRISLELTAVRVEQLQAITEEDARAEGVTPFPANPEGDCWTDGKHRTAFEHLWNDLHGWAPNSWMLNPWVWVLTFDVHPRSES